MKMIKPTLSLLIIFYSFTFFIPAIIYAGIDLPWSTSFDCEEYVETHNNFTPNCPGIEVGLWGDIVGTAITTLANNPLGSGRGIKFLKGDGTNNSSLAARISFNDYQKEIWIRWYIKYEEGFAWSSLLYDKLIYLYT